MSNETPAPEITPAMLRAGELVLRDHADGCIGPYTAKHTVVEIYRAMRAAAVDAEQNDKPS